MVFILPENKQGLGRSLLSGIAQGLPGGMQLGIENLLKQKQISAEEEAKSRRARSLLQGIEEMGSVPGESGQFTDKQILSMKLSGDPILMATADFLEKKEQKERPQRETRETAQRSFDDAATILKKGNLGRGSGIKGFFGGKTARDVGAFNTAVGGLEAMLVDMVSRGTLSNSRFQYITETLLPKSNDTQSAIKGKLESLASILGLDPGSLGIEKKEPKIPPPKNEGGFVKMRTPDGKIVRVPHSKAAAASKAGGKIIE